MKYLCVTPSLPESHVWNQRKYGTGVQFRAVELEFKSNPIFQIFSDFIQFFIRFYPIFIRLLSDFFRFFLIFRIFLTFRLADSTALVQLDFVTIFCRENAKEESTHMGRKFSAFPAVF